MVAMHPREQLVMAAEQKLLTTWIEVARGLTEAEQLRVAAAFVSERIGGIAKYAIRRERHGNENEPGGLT